MARLLKDLAGATATLFWPVSRPLAVVVLAWAADAHDLPPGGHPTDA
jgi:hypothetical protein